MVGRNEDDKFVLFEKSSGMTAEFSGDMLAVLKKDIKSSQRTPFITRLIDLGILTKDFSAKELLSYISALVKNSPVKAVHLEITNYCSLHCPFCYKGHLENSHFPLEKAKLLVDEMVSLDLFQLALGGGEPLVYPHLIEFLQYIQNTPLAVTLTSSGYGLTSTLLQSLQNSGLNHFQISLNGVTRETHERSRDGYKWGIKGSELLSSSSLSWGINFVAIKNNLHELLDVYRFAETLGADNINILRYKPSVFENYNEHALSQEETQKLVEIIRKCSGSVKMKVDSAYSQLLYYLHGTEAMPYGFSCGAGQDFVALNVYGEYSPCSHLPYENTPLNLIDYLESEELMIFQQKLQNQKSACTSCIYTPFCNGCMAVEQQAKSLGQHHCFAYDKGEY